MPNKPEKLEDALSNLQRTRKRTLIAFPIVALALILAFVLITRGPGAESTRSASGHEGSTATRAPMLKGSSVNAVDDLARWKAGIGHDLPIIRRFYTGSLPSTWSADSVLAALPLSTRVVVSFKYGSTASVAAFLKSKPVGQIVYVSYYHEPEDNISAGAFSLAYYRLNWSLYGPVITANGGKPTLILMRYTLNANSGRDWHNYYVKGAVKVMDWDSYNSAQPTGYSDYTKTAIPPMVAVATETKLPWGVAEFGSPVVGTSADRAAWAAAARDGLYAAGAKHVCWWDGYNPANGFDSRADAAIFNVWK